MSTITGSIINQSGAAAANIPIVFRYLSNPAVAGAFGVYAPDKTVTTDVSGQFSTVLPMGKYSMIVGSVATYTIVVPDDSATYDFTDRLDPEVTVTQSVATPLAVLGLWLVENIAALRAVPNATSNRLGVLYAPDDADDTFYRWDGASYTTDNGDTAIKPNDTDGADPGRWHKIPITVTGATGPMDYVADMATLQAIPGSTANKVRLVADAAAPHALWYYVHGDSALNADGVNVVRASDNLGNWYSRQAI